ncbi:SDR family oxidoreductase [Candidatus Auribacterota bacterium]
MEKYLVTGGAGFIGSNIVETLLKKNKNVKILDNFLTGKKENIELFAKEVELIEGDLRDKSAVKRAVQDVDYVIHLAALPSVPRSVKNPLLSNDINISGTLTLLEGCKEAKVRRLVFASSSAVYGGRAPLPVKESYATSPISPYGLTKLCGEHYVRLFYELYGLETVSLRYFNVFGPRQDPKSQYAAVIPKFITAILKDDSPTVFGDGEQSRDFTFVANVVEANIKACEAGKEALGKSFNIACEQSLSLNQLLSLINKKVGKEVKAIYTYARSGDIKHSLASIEEAEKYLNFKPLVSTEEGLSKTIEWFEKI